MQPITLKMVMKGTVPSKKNNQIIKTTKTGKTYVTASAAYKAWYKVHYQKVVDWLYEKTLLHPELEVPITQKIKFKVLFYFGDDRDRDLSNKIETLQDLLKDAGVIYDDSYRILSLESDGKYTKGNTRTEIYFTIKTWKNDPELLALYERRRLIREERHRKKLASMRFDLGDVLE